MGKRNHFAPQFLLRRFVAGDSGLWLLDKATGERDRRNPSNAGMIRGLYSDKLEDGYLQEIDGVAAAILQSSVYSREAIALQEHERGRIAEWLATLVQRNPKKLIETERFLARAYADPKSVIDPEIDYGVEYVKVFEREHPEFWVEQVEEIKNEPTLQLAISEAGAAEVLRRIIAKVVNNDVRDGKLTSEHDDPSDIFCRLINRTRAADWAAWVLNYHWSWWKTDGDFIIGDDPVCCWSPTLKHVEYGVGHPDCEITFPVSRQLCLVMRQSPCDSHAVQSCDRKTTAIYNNRQWLAASRFLYGSSIQIARERDRLLDIAAGRIRYPKGG